MLILLLYLVILLGNEVLILVTILDSRLHTPMYFFLGNLSFLGIHYKPPQSRSSLTASAGPAVPAPPSPPSANLCMSNIKTLMYVTSSQHISIDSVEHSFTKHLPTFLCFLQKNIKKPPA